MKLVADAIWSKLTGSFSKDILHAQVRQSKWLWGGVDRWDCVVL